MKELGFKDVFHLEGGILKYLEMTQKGKSLWRGECFVFDQRVSVGHGLKVGPNFQTMTNRYSLVKDKTLTTPQTFSLLSHL